MVIAQAEKLDLSDHHEIPWLTDIRAPIVTARVKEYSDPSHLMLRSIATMAPWWLDRGRNHGVPMG